MKKIISKNAKMTMQIAKKLAKKCKIGDIVLLYGDLGAGKTVFSKGFTSAFSKANVTSPTFTIINVYPGKIPVYHFDLYRIKNSSELNDVGAEEYLYGDGISLVEWPERARELFGKDVISVTITKLGDSEREIKIEGKEND